MSFRVVLVASDGLSFDSRYTGQLFDFISTNIGHQDIELRLVEGPSGGWLCL